MLLAILGAIAVGLCLGLLGSGSSMLTLPILLYLIERPNKIAIAESLAIVGSIALVGAAIYTFKRQVDWKSVTFFGLTGMVGANCGAICSCYISGATQVTLFACVMMIASYLILADKTPYLTPLTKQRSTSLLMANGFLVGSLTGLIGVGGGFLIVPALVIVASLPIHMAIGTSLVIIALNAFSGFSAHLRDLSSKKLSVDWTIVLLFIAVGSLGTLLGALINRKLPQKQLKTIFAFSSIIVAVYILFREV